MPKYNKSIIGGLDDFLSEEDPLTKVREDIRKNITGESKKEKLVSEDVLIDYTDEDNTNNTKNTNNTNEEENKSENKVIEEEVNNIIDENDGENEEENNLNDSNNNANNYETEIPSIECATVDKKEAKTYTPSKPTGKKKESSCFCC